MNLRSKPRGHLKSMSMDRALIRIKRCLRTCSETKMHPKKWKFTRKKFKEIRKILIMRRPYWNNSLVRRHPMLWILLQLQVKADLVYLHHRLLHRRWIFCLLHRPHLFLIYPLLQMYLYHLHHLLIYFHHLPCHQIYFHHLLCHQIYFHRLLQ